MKVLYVGGDALATGASISMLKLIDELDKFEDLSVVPVVHTGNTESTLKRDGRDHYVVNAQSWVYKRRYSPLKKILIRVIKSTKNIICYFEYKKIIKRERPDIVHINAATTYIAAKAAYNQNIPIIWHIREMIEEDFDAEFWDKKYALNLMNKAYRCIAISKCVEEKFSKLLDNNKVTRIYNGVDSKLFYDETHQVFQNDTIVITMAGRINENKGQVLCLKELIPILKENANIVLQFAGDGPDKETKRLTELIDKSGLSSGRIKLLGFVKEIDKIWKKTDIAVVYSKFEAFGRVTVEAKMGGALVVGYDSGGTSELIEHEVDGYLFGNRYDNLYNTISRVLHDKTYAAKVAKRGRDSANRQYSSEKNAYEIHELYKSKDELKQSH